MGKILHFSRCSTGEKQRMAQDQNTEEVSRSIRMPKYIWDALDADADRCDRSSVGQIRALLRMFYFNEDVEIEREKLQSLERASAVKSKAQRRA